MKKLLSFLSALIICIGTVYSQDCQIPSVIASGEFKLLKSCSPYIAPKSVVVNVGATLTSEPGVEIQMPDSAVITVNGSISIIGTNAEPIHFRKTDNATRWLRIYIYKSIDSVKFENVIFDDAMQAVYSHNSKMNINHCTAHNVIDFVKVKYGSAKVSDNKIYVTEDTGELTDINVILGVETKLSITNNLVQGPSKGRKFDLIDVTKSSNIVIENNFLIGNKVATNSDCIDLDKCTNILIKNNIIHNIKDKGISIGNKGSGKIIGNIVYNASVGIAIKDTSDIQIINNTFNSNDTTIYLRNHGIANISNTIIDGSKKINVYNSVSTVTFKYSLCNNELLAGTGNIKADPLFVDAAQQNFNLKSNSPCIDKGDPATSFDPDNTRADIGALYYNQNKTQNLFINEFLVINTNLTDENNEYDSWLEIYNANNFEIDLAGLYLSNDPNDPLKYKIPQISDATKIAAGGYKLIWCDNQPEQGPLHTNFLLSSDKVQLALNQVVNSETILMDSLSSGKQTENISYCRYPDGNKYSEYTLAPTPGESNILIINITEESDPENSVRIYPNPASDHLSVSLNISKACKAHITLLDITGKQIISEEHILNNAGTYDIKISNNKSGNLNLTQGIYLLSIQTDKKLINRKIVITGN